MIERMVGALITAGTSMLTGAQARWLGCGPSETQRIYYANHASHVDFALIWTALPPRLRQRTRPVAAGDYWSRGTIRRYLIHQVFRGVLIERSHIDRDHNPITAMGKALDEGASLILFPEGTRGSGGEVQSFKAGVFHLAQRYQSVELVPAWIDNAYRVMPKGFVLPVPLLCSVTFGEPRGMREGEHKDEFLERLRQALLEVGKV